MLSGRCLLLLSHNGMMYIFFMFLRERDALSLKELVDKGFLL